MVESLLGAKIELLKVHVTHSSFLDFQLPKNLRQEYINIDRSGKYPIYRSCSGLVQLCDNNVYREIRPNLMGEYIPINPKLSFGCSLRESEADNKLRTFGQGVVTRIKSLRVFYRQIGTDFHENCSTYKETFGLSTGDELSVNKNCSQHYRLKTKLFGQRSNLQRDRRSRFW